MTIRAILGVVALSQLIGPALADSATSSRPISEEARDLVQQVHAASKRRDLAALAKLMDRDFVSSFGGEGGIDEAIADWQNFPYKLERLHRVTGASCESVGEIVQCPRGAGAGYRAGFKQSKDGWRMSTLLLATSYCSENGSAFGHDRSVACGGLIVGWLRFC